MAASASISVRRGSFTGSPYFLASSVISFDDQLGQFSWIVENLLQAGFASLRAARRVPLILMPSSRASWRRRISRCPFGLDVR